MKASKFFCLLIQVFFVLEYAGVEGLKKCYLCSYTYTVGTEVGKECIYGTERTIDICPDDRPCTLTKVYTETWGPRVSSFSRGCTEGLVDGCKYDSPTSNHYTCKTVCDAELCNSGSGESLPLQVTTSTTTTTTRKPRRYRLGNKGTYLVSNQVLTYSLLLAFSLVSWG